MNFKGFSILCIFFMLCSCHNETTGNDNSSKEETFYVDLVADMPKEDSHQWQEFSYVDFPSYPSATSNLHYVLSDDQSFYYVSRNSQDWSQTTIVIPETYNNKPVKVISAEGFAYLSNLSTIYIPSTIETIEAGAFNGTALKKVYYNAKSVNDLNGRNWVFYPSEKQSIDIYFGPMVERIPARLFYPLSTEPDKIPHVNNIYFDGQCQIKEIGAYAFYKLAEVKDISLPTTISKIEDYAFYESGIDEIVLPTSLESIGEYAFANSEISHVKFNDVLTSIGKYAFYRAMNLSYVDLSKTKLTSIANSAFEDCISINEVIFSQTVTSIGHKAFKKCQKLHSIILHDNILSIGEEAFAEANEASYVSLGRSLKAIGHKAFMNCVSVQKIHIYSQHLDNFNPLNNVFCNFGNDVDNLKVIFKGVEYIPKYIFYASGLIEEQANIKQVIIDNTVKEIGKSAFFNLTLSSIDYLGNVTSWNKINIHDNNIILNNVQCHESIAISIN